MRHFCVRVRFRSLMKKSLLIFALFAIVFVFSLFAKISNAQLLDRPFGGRILTSTGVGGFCAGVGPISIIPSGAYPPAPYFVPAGNPFLLTNPVIPGAWILGLYSTTMLPGCTAFGVPIPAFPILIYGTSKAPSI